jgi:hypothetical protein
MRHNPDRGIMNQFMQHRAMPVDRLEVARRRRHLDKILARHIKGTVAADANVGAGRADQRLGLRQDEVFARRHRRRRQIFRQILALVGVEHREALQKRDRFGLVACFFVARALAPGNEAIGKDDRRAFFALLDVRADLEGLAKCEPALGGEAALGDRGPQNENIDPRVSAAGGSVFR